MKLPNIKFHGNMSSGSCADTHKQTTGGLTDGHDEADSCSSRLHELAKKGIFFNLYISAVVFVALSTLFSASWVPNFGGINDSFFGIDSEMKQDFNPK
jgi:hypothetical protein